LLGNGIQAYLVLSVVVVELVEEMREYVSNFKDSRILGA
jgi:hypothetical protein